MSSLDLLVFSLYPEVMARPGDEEDDDDWLLKFGSVLELSATPSVRFFLLKIFLISILLFQLAWLSFDSGGRCTFPVLSEDGKVSPLS